MDAAARVRQEYYDLQAFLNQAHGLFPDAFSEWPIQDVGLAGASIGSSSFPHQTSENRPSKALKPDSRLRSSDYAEWVLKVHGTLHLSEILKRMREEGWRGNASDGTASKTLFNVLASKPDRFTNLGKNLWKLREKGD